MSDATNQRGAVGFNKEGQLVLPGFPEGFAQGLTLEAWVRVRHHRPRSRILEFSDGSRERGALFLGLGDDAGSLMLGVDGREGQAQVIAPGALPEGRWVHVAATIDAQGLAALYVEGVLAASGLLRQLAATDFSVCYAGQGSHEPSFDGELSQLALWRRVLDPETVSSCRQGLLRGDEPGLAAWYPLDAISKGQVLDQGPAKRHARVNGQLECQPSTELSQAMADVPLAASFLGSASLQLPPVTPESFKDGLTFQAWIRPHRAGRPALLMELGGGRGKERLVLRRAEGSDALVIEAQTREPGPIPKGGHNPLQGPQLQLERICEVPGVLPAGRWTHVSAILDPHRKQCTVSVNGRVVHEAPMATSFFASKQVCTHCYLGRSIDDGSPFFVGSLAEVRLWQKPLPQQELSKNWLSRVRGDEPALLACYRLDGLENGLAIDTSSRRMHARVLGIVKGESAQGLPLRSVTRKGQPEVAVQGKLLTDWLPLSAFPSNRTLAGVKAPKGMKGTSWLEDALDGAMKTQTRTLNAIAYGTLQDSLVRSSVYEVIVEPRDATGEPMGGTQVELSFDKPREVLRSEAGKVWIEAWPGRSPRKVTVPDNGRLRLCVLAGDKLDCPSVRVRCEGMAPDAWVVARPADSAQEALLKLSGDELRQPKQPGKAPVLNKDTKADDAEAVAELLRCTAQALPLSPSGSGGSRYTTKKVGLGSVGDLGKDVWHGVESGAGDVANFGERTVKHASDLLVDGAESLEKLVKKAANATLQVGAQAARQCIRGAKQLAIDTGASLQGGGEAVWGVVQIIGTTVVNGSDQAFRVMVSGVTEVIEAIEEIARKVGAAIQKIIDYLCMLFQWDRFLANAERIYKSGLEMLKEAERHTGALKDLRSKIEQLVKAPLDSSLARKTVGQVIGVSKKVSMPGYDELNYLLDQIDSAFSAFRISIKGGDSKSQKTSKDTTPDGLSSAGSQCVAALPSELFVSPDKLLSIPMKPLMAAPSEIWALLSPVCDPVLKTIEEGASHAVKDARSTLTGRLYVPVFTELVETVVLGGKELNMLRLAALLGSIPMTLSASVRGKSKKEKQQQQQAQGSAALTSSKSASGESPAQKAKKEEEKQDPDALAWLQFSISLVNSVLIGLRALYEAKKEKVEATMRVLFALSGAFALLMAGLDLYLAFTEFPEGDARNCGIAHGIFAIAAGGWLCAMAGLWTLEENTKLSLADAAIEILLGIAELVTTIAAVSLGSSEQQELKVIGFRCGNWLLRAIQKVFDGADNDTGAQGSTPASGGTDNASSKFLSAKTLNLATCALIAALDITEGVYLAAETASGD